MIFALKWIPRGFAQEFPEKLDLDDNEMERISKLAKMELEDANLDLEEAMKGADMVDEVDDESQDSDENQDEEDQDSEGKSGHQGSSGNGSAGASADPMAKYNMDDYDNEPDTTAFASVRGQSHFAPDEKDEHLVDTNEDEEEERLELQILPTDNMIITAKAEDQVPMIDAYVYDDSGEHDTTALYVHHDFMLPDIPLCLEWIPYKLGSDNQAGNNIAIGTFSPAIEIWNLDVVDAVFPAAILGQQPKDAKLEAKGTGKKKRNLKKSNDEYHVDAVLGLASNPNHVNLLASASADCTVKLWDLQTQKAAKSFGFHESKVSSVKWNPTESTVLLTGGYDHQAIVSDLRIESDNGSRKYRVEGGVEGVQWHPNGTHFFVSNDKGQVYKFDARVENKPVWTLHAHDDEVSCFDINQHIPDLMVTGSSDKRVKLWNLSDDKPSMLLSRDFDVGRVFTVGFAPDEAVRGVLAVGGHEGKMKVWNTFANKAVRSTMAKNYEFKGTDQIITASDDEEEEEDDDMEDE